MKTGTIEIPEGYVIDAVDTESGSVKFKPKPKDVMGIIRTVDDVLKDNGLTAEEFDRSCEGLTTDEKAYRILKLLAKSLNQGWEPNWDDSDEYKYFPWFYMQKGSSGFRFGVGGLWRAYSYVGSRLCYKSSELAEHAGRTFTEVYKQFMIIE